MVHSFVEPKFSFFIIRIKHVGFYLEINGVFRRKPFHIVSLYNLWKHIWSTTSTTATSTTATTGTTTRSA